MRKSTLSGVVAAMAMATVLLPAAQAASAADTKSAAPTLTAECHNTHFYYGRYHRMSRLICDHHSDHGDNRGYADGSDRRVGGTHHNVTDGHTTGHDTTGHDTTGHDTGAVTGTGTGAGHDGGVRRP